MDPYHTRYTPETTPPFLRNILIAFGLGGILSGLFYRTAAFSMGLSYSGILQGKFWQLVTYPFVLGAPLSWWSIFFLALELVFFWIYSASLLEQKGGKSFFTLIAGSALSGGLASLAMQSPVPLTGIAPIFFGILIAWAHMRRSASLLIFGFSIKANMLILSFIGLDILIHFSQNNWVPMAANAGGALFGWLYAKLPVLSFHKSKSGKQPKIYDFRSGRPVLDDEKFMDDMLARISLHGEQSLTPDEKLRMEKISRKNFQEER